MALLHGLGSVAIVGSGPAPPPAPRHFASSVRPCRTRRHEALAPLSALAVSRPDRCRLDLRLAARRSPGLNQQAANRTGGRPSRPAARSTMSRASSRRRCHRSSARRSWSTTRAAPRARSAPAWWPRRRRKALCSRWCATPTRSPRRRLPSFRSTPAATWVLLRLRRRGRQLRQLGSGSLGHWPSPCSPRASGSS